LSIYDGKKIPYLLILRNIKLQTGRLLFRHGAYFDFMLSWAGFRPTEEAWKDFREIIRSEIEYSQQSEEMIFHSRSKKKKHYTVLQRRLYLKKI